MKNQKGFSVIEGIIISFVILVIGIAVYTVVLRNRDKYDETKTSNNSSGGVIAILNPQEEAEKSPYQQCVDDNNETSIVNGKFQCRTGDMIYFEDGSTQEVPVIQSDSEVSETWKIYSNDDFEFIYPERWDYLPDLAYSWEPIIISDADGYSIGGGLGPKLTYNASANKWVILELGRYPGDRKVGDEFDLYKRKSDTGITVYDYTEGDGDFSSTTLLFVSNNKMNSIILPDVCSGDECINKSTYNNEQISKISDIISKSVVLKN